jgi:hypothetical protein
VPVPPPLALPAPSVGLNVALAGRRTVPMAVQRLARALAEAVGRWVETQERALRAMGWQAPPRRPPDLPLRAERLIRRAVLRQSWRQIAIATGASDLHLVRRQVLADAGLLGVVLPGSGR